MINLTIALILSLINISSDYYSDFELPTVWTKDFKIIAQTGGGMLDQDTKVTITYDTCMYYYQLRGKVKKNSFAMTAAQRAEVLAKMRALKVNKLRLDNMQGIAYDKSTTVISLYQKENFFSISDGATSTIRDADVQDFRDAFNYLITFANPK